MQADENNPAIKLLAHDLNNIFTRILNSIELLKRKINPSEEAMALLNNIEASTYLATEIIEDATMDFRRNILSRRININSVVNDVVRSLSFQVKDRINFELALEPELNLINAKFSDIYRVILNLVTNSIEAIPGNGIIKMRTCNLDPHKISFAISDNGTGIDKKILPHVFEEDFSTKEKRTISGIGLSVVKKMVDNYSGKIELISIPGTETTFTLIFPAFSSAVSQSINNEKSILIAEDEDVLRELLAELLRSYNYNITTVCNGNDTLEAINTKKYDLLIIDRKMPFMDGIECIKEIRKNDINIPVILASGSQGEELEISAETKIEKILNKPYNFEEMLSVVKELIG